MSLTNTILDILSTDFSKSYKLIRGRLDEDFLKTSDKNQAIKNYKKIKDQTLRTTLSRLKKKGLLENKNNIWQITQKGIKHIKNNSRKTPHFKIDQKHKSKDLIIIFDIPEENSKKRNWLRGELIGLNFALLQKSVWIGPSPLPKEFIKYLNEINLLPFIKFFKVKETDVI